MERYSVYKHITPDGRIYIGITKRVPSQRWRNGLGYRDSHNSQFWQAICHFGWENIQHETLFENLSKEEAECKETELISLEKSAQEQFGYNITAGGPGALGRICSEEARNKIGNANKGREFSTKEKARRSVAAKGENNPMYGRAGNQNPRYGITGEKHPLFGKTGADCKNSKPVMNITTGKIYISATEAAESLALDMSSICACCRRKRKTCGGYEWQFI